MRGDIQGGVLATLIAAPLMIVCCGGGGVALDAITGAVGGWIGGVGGLAAVLVAVVAALFWHSRRRALGDAASWASLLKGNTDHEW